MKGQKDPAKQPRQPHGGLLRIPAATCSHFPSLSLCWQSCFYRRSQWTPELNSNSNSLPPQTDLGWWTSTDGVSQKRDGGARAHHSDDLISFSDCGETVCNYQSRPTTHEALQCLRRAHNYPSVSLTRNKLDLGVGGLSVHFQPYFKKGRVRISDILLQNSLVG